MRRNGLVAGGEVLRPKPIATPPFIFERQKLARRPPEIELVFPRMLALILARGKYVRLRAASLTRNA